MKNTPTSVATSMPNTTAVPSACSRAQSDRERDGAQDESERSHQDRAEPQLRAVQGRLYDGLALLALQPGEFHDEDRVLGGEPHQHDQPDLRVDVVVQGAHEQAQERAE